MTTAIETVKPGTYRHYKGMLYNVLHVARHSESQEQFVVYQAHYGEHGVWIRPLTMFVETVRRDGKDVPRFEYVGDPRDEGGTRIAGADRGPPLQFPPKRPIQHRRQQRPQLRLRLRLQPLDRTCLYHHVAKYIERPRLTFALVIFDRASSNGAKSFAWGSSTSTVRSAR
jgi:hypothetical protein